MRLRKLWVPGWTHLGEKGGMLTQEQVSYSSHKTGANLEGCWPVEIAMKKFRLVKYLPVTTGPGHLPLPSTSSTFHPSHPRERTAGGSCATSTQGQWQVSETGVIRPSN